MDRYRDLEASALSRATNRGLLARRSPLLRFESDARLIALIRAGHDQAFEVLFNRYHSRLLAFCQSMLRSRQDAEDVLQEVFANAHAAMLGDQRAINCRPWLYRIARNRCLNHLRRPVPEGQDSMDVHPHQHGVTTAERVQTREELRQVLSDVKTLPETQRTALLLREIDQLTYEEISQAMQTTVPAIKSLLVRARIGLAESSKARMLTCTDVQLELAEAAEGIAKASGPARKHVRGCDGCREFRSQLRSDRRALAALFPVGILAVFQHTMLSKLFGGGAAGGGGAVGGASTVGGATGGVGGIGALGSAIGAKAAAGVATAALLTAGAVEVKRGSDPAPATDAATRAIAPTPTPFPAATPEVIEFAAANHATRPATGPKSAPPGAATGDAPAAPVERRSAPPAQAAPVEREPAVGADDVEEVVIGEEVGPSGIAPTDSEGQEPGSAEGGPGAAPPPEPTPAPVEPAPVETTPAPAPAVPPSPAPVEPQPAPTTPNDA